MNICKCGMPLNKFLADPLWWDQEAASSDRRGEPAVFASEVSAEHAHRDLPRDVQNNVRQLLRGAYFESLEQHGKCSERKDEDKGEQIENRASSAAVSTGGMSCLSPRRVPPCFAPFTRFNCNVTLVAQKLFASELAVSVLCRGSVAVEGEDVLRVLQHARAGERVYRRHVMLHLNNNSAGFSEDLKEPISYGFLVTTLQALPPEARELVLSERLPFGAILDLCGVRRSVETEKQLHVHIGREFFRCYADVTQAAGSSGATSVNGAEKHQEACQGRTNKTTEECKCERLPEGFRCTFGRLTTILCDGKPAARVIEILNDKLLLNHLLELEESQTRQPLHTETFPGCRSDDSPSSVRQRAGFLSARCLLCVAACPVHCSVLPKPHVTAQELRLPRSPGGACRLCGSTSCSTDFESAFTEDLFVRVQ